MPKLNPSEVRFLQRALALWFGYAARNLPWRRTYEPYPIWISEIMLQQTQVKTVLPYFERWAKRLPTIRDVAEADEEVILKLWEGLGYYSRARNIQKAAQVIVEKFNGEFPQRHEEILSLPGIGKYTAGAIASIAFNQDQPIVDGNVIRVLARLMGFRANVRLPRNTEKIWGWARQLLPSGKARHFNQALMELGALICKPKNPLCGQCPVQKICLAYQKSLQEILPNLGERRKLESIRVALAVIRKGKKVFIQKRPPTGLMPGLWEFPGGKIQRRESVPQALRREIREELGITIKNMKFVKRIQHGYTRFQVDLHCFLAEHGSGRVRLSAATRGKWVSLDQLKHHAFPAANKRLIDEITRKSF